MWLEIQLEVTSVIFNIVMKSTFPTGVWSSHVMGPSQPPWETGVCGTVTGKCQIAAYEPRIYCFKGRGGTTR